MKERKYRAINAPAGKKTRKPTKQKIPWAIISLWYESSGASVPWLVVPCVLPDCTFVRSNRPLPVSRCRCITASTAVEPGFMAPRAKTISCVTSPFAWGYCEVKLVSMNKQYAHRNGKSKPRIVGRGLGIHQDIFKPSIPNSEHSQNSYIVARRLVGEDCRQQSAWHVSGPNAGKVWLSRLNWPTLSPSVYSPFESRNHCNRLTLRVRYLKESSHAHPSNSVLSSAWQNIYASRVI